jgi:hypothetical protein
LITRALRPVVLQGADRLDHLPGQRLLGFRHPLDVVLVGFLALVLAVRIGFLNLVLAVALALKLLADGFGGLLEPAVLFLEESQEVVDDGDCCAGGTQGTNQACDGNADIGISTLLGQRPGPKFLSAFSLSPGVVYEKSPDQKQGSGQGNGHELARGKSGAHVLVIPVVLLPRAASIASAWAVMVDRA